MRNRGVIHRGDARIGIYFRRQLVGSDRRDSGRSGLGQTGVLDAGSAPHARRSQCARAVAAGLGARSGRFVAARRGSLGAYGSGRRTDRRLAQRSSASIVRISGGGRSGDVAGQDAGLPLSMAGPGSSDFGWQLRQQARQQRHGLAGARGLRSGRGRLQPFRADGQARRRSARSRSRDSRRNPARRPQLFERQRLAALARERRQDRRRRLSGPAALEFAASARSRRQEVRSGRTPAEHAGGQTDRRPRRPDRGRGRPDANAHRHQAQIRGSRASRAPAFAEPGAQEGQDSRSAQPARRWIRRAGDLPGRRDLSRRRTSRHLSPALADRTRFQETEEFVEPRSPASSNRKRRAKLDLGASDPRHRDRRLQPGFPGLFPLWTCSTPDTARRSGASRRSSSGYYAQLSWDTSPSNASKPPTPAFTACSLSRPESEKTRCNTRSAPYPSAYGATHPQIHRFPKVTASLTGQGGRFYEHLRLRPDRPRRWYSQNRTCGPRIRLFGSIFQKSSVSWTETCGG